MTAGRARGLLRDILNRGRAKVDALLDSLERLEDLMRRYESRRDGSGARRSLAEDIRMASVEALLPGELERHVQLNRSRWTSYEELQTVVALYVETRVVGSAPRVVKPSAARVVGDPLDVDALFKGGGGGAAAVKGQ